MDWPWIDLVNSLAHDPLGKCGCEDRLRKAAWLERYLERWKLGPLPAPRDAAVEALADLRCLLRRCADRLADGRTLRSADVRAINRLLEAQPLVARLQPRDEHPLCLELIPTEPGLPAILAAVARSFARFVCEVDPARLKRCDNPDCGWLFHDTTRSRTKRWCADSCGNLIKVRRFREKKKDG